MITFNHSAKLYPNSSLVKFDQDFCSRAGVKRTARLLTRSLSSARYSGEVSTRVSNCASSLVLPTSKYPGISAQNADVSVDT